MYTYYVHVGSVLRFCAMMMFHLDELIGNFVFQGLLALEAIPEMCLVKFFTGNEMGGKCFVFKYYLI